MVEDICRNKAFWLLAAAWPALLSSPAAGQEVLNIDGIDTEAGETEIELETRILDEDPGAGLFIQAQFEHALSDRWAIGGELELERDPGDALLADAALASLKWRAPRGNSGFGFALQVSAGYASQDRAVVGETAAYLGWSNAAWSLSSKFDVEQVFERGAEPEFGYRLRLARQLGDDLEIGIEGAGDLWTADDPQHRIGPYIELPLGGDEAPALELGAFAGLTRNTPDIQYRVEIVFEF